MVRAFLAASAAVLAIVAYPAASQDVAPAELPPESFAANQYIDSEGCAFIRAGIGGETSWVPHMSRQREQLCGFEPTFAAPPEPQVADAEDVEAPETGEAVAATAPAASQPAAAPSAAPRVAAAPRRSPAVSPRVVSPPPPPPQPVKITKAEFCVGRSGIQQGYIGDRSGLPIDCGPARVSRRPLEGKVTLAAVCADMAVSGRRYLLKESGSLLDCSAYAARPTAAPEKPRGAVAEVPQGYRFVQVGAYAEAANAERAVARLHGLGLPVARSGLIRGSVRLQVIATGPFETSAKLSSALQAARAAGYSDAFLRR